MSVKPQSRHVNKNMSECEGSPSDPDEHVVESGVLLSRLVSPQVPGAYAIPAANGCWMNHLLFHLGPVL